MANNTFLARKKPMTDHAARFALSFAALVALTACGGGGGAAPTPPPTPVPAPPPPAPVPAPTPVSIQSMQPADGSKTVDIRPTMRIVLSGSVDVGSVTPDHVRLMSKGYPQRITLSYDDASHTLSVTPGTLSHDTTYTLSVSGLVATGGATIASQQASFSTWVNHQLDSLGPDGTVVSSFTLHASGHPTRGPDPDGGSGYASYTYLANGLLSDTTDWTLNSDLTTYSLGYTLHDTYDANGALVSESQIYGRADQQFFNALDTYAYDAFGEQVLDTHAVAGSDKTLGTGDDQPGYSATLYDDQGNEAMRTSGSQIASDGRTIPVGAMTSYSVHTSATSSTPERWTNYMSAGPDGKFLTADDIIDSYSEITRDAHGNIVRVVFFETPFASPAGTALALSSCTVSSYDDHDNLVKRVTYTDPGPDGVWFTADDTIFGTTTYDTTR